MFLKICEDNTALRRPQCESTSFLYCLFQQLPFLRFGLEAGGSRREAFNSHPNALCFSSFPAEKLQDKLQMTVHVTKCSCLSTCSKDRQGRWTNSRLPDSSWFTGCWGEPTHAKWLQKRLLEPEKIYGTFMQDLIILMVIFVKGAHLSPINMENPKGKKNNSHYLKPPVTWSYLVVGKQDLLLEVYHIPTSIVSSTLLKVSTMTAETRGQNACPSYAISRHSSCFK